MSDLLPWEIEEVDVPEAEVLPAILADYRVVKSQIVDVHVTDDNATEVASFAKKLTGFETQAKDAMKAELEPHEAAAKAVKTKFKPLFDEISRLKILCRSKLTEYQSELSRKQREAAEAERQKQIAAMKAEADKYAAKGDFDNAVAVQETAKVVAQEQIITTRTIKGTDASTSLRVVWKYEIVDAGQVPREYCEPSKYAINKAVQSGVRSIPGVRIYPENSVTIR
jgi:hypothetical protein